MEFLRVVLSEKGIEELVLRLKDGGLICCVWWCLERMLICLELWVGEWLVGVVRGLGVLVVLRWEVGDFG